MSRIIVVFTVLFLLSFQLLFGQSNNTNSTNISIVLRSGITINQISGDLDFGEVYFAGNSQTLTKDPELGALFEVRGIPKKRISVNYSYNIALNNSDWVNSNGGVLGNLIFTPFVEETGEVITYTKPKKLRNNNSIKIGNDNGVGRLFIWVGGTLVINENQPLGDYEGMFNITVAY